MRVKCQSQRAVTYQQLRTAIVNFFVHYYYYRYRYHYRCGSCGCSRRHRRSCSRSCSCSCSLKTCVNPLLFLDAYFVFFELTVFSITVFAVCSAVTFAFVICSHNKESSDLTEIVFIVGMKQCM